MSGLSPTIRSAYPSYLPYPVELVADNGKILHHTGNMQIYPHWCESSIVALDVDFFITISADEELNSGEYHIRFPDDAGQLFDIGFELASGYYFGLWGKFELDDEDPNTLEIELGIKLKGLSINPATSLFRVELTEQIDAPSANDD